VMNIGKNPAREKYICKYLIKLAGMRGRLTRFLIIGNDISNL
jgi:hypothetical protein